MATPDRTRGLRVERYGWTVFLFISLVIFLFGITDIFTGAATFGQGEAPTFRGITGTTWESTRNSPLAAEFDWMVRAQAIWMMLVGGLSGLISVTAFRRGERWAWVAMALWPITVAAIDINLLLAVKHAGAGVPPPLVSGAFVIVLSILTLALTFGRAFRTR